MLIASALFVLNVCVLLYGVVARYLVGHSPIWMDELSRYLIIGTVLLVLAPAWLQQRHMRVDFLESMLPRRLKMALRLYSWLLVLGLSGYIAWISWHYAFSVQRFMTMGLGISKTIPLLSIPIGFGCLFVAALIHGPDLKGTKG
ncbi:TRAP transporter small permease [Motiliproteus coralliicola]|nr:TRAP transporter small permease [Motiliproteus coralliicola]